MSAYHIEIQKLVNAALDEMGQEHVKGRLTNAPVSNTNFLLRWITKSIKGQRFHRLASGDLIKWQKSGRSKGTQLDLPTLFRQISTLYSKLAPVDQEPKAILDSEIEAFIDFMEEKGWAVCTEYDAREKIQVFTEGDSSFLLCSHQCDDCFDGENLVKPMSWYVRGNHAEFVKLATEQGFLVHKVTDYKSKVKYHGEYLIFPNNHGPQLAEIPIGYAMDS
ncbi:DUF2913 family protein [Vibrio nigripulchritudo]|uniref:DUF2913 family protein n=1 Tax=Vibrio nigripulchritudo TaxID=28173 RepID=UPI0003B20F54|nr:DUF2913 family protein [Vibrio nigripulchritudo]CCN68951.1 conserved hypothetical protein [Vibrio nigripulchritudo SFn118]